MPRRSRIDAPGALQHIIARGINRQRIFKDDADRDNFLDRLGNILSETQTDCLPGQSLGFRNQRSVWLSGAVSNWRTATAIR